MKHRLRVPSPSLAISLLALFVALGGTAYAAVTLPKNSVGTKQLKKSAVTGRKIKNHTIGKIKLKKKTVAALKGNTGPQGPRGYTGAQGLQGPAGTARAYATVLRGSPPSLETARTKNFSAVTNPSTGVYCLTPSGGVTVAGTSPAVTVDYRDSAGSNLSAYWYDSTNGYYGGCTAGQFEVVTLSFTAGGNNTFSNNVAFTIVVP